MKKKMGYLALVVFLTAIAIIVQARAPTGPRDERYAVGGELIPVTASPYLFSPAFLIVIAVAAAIIVAGGAILSDKISIEVNIGQ